MRQLVRINEQAAELQSRAADASFAIRILAQVSSSCVHARMPTFILSYSCMHACTHTHTNTHTHTHSAHRQTPKARADMNTTNAQVEEVLSERIESAVTNSPSAPAAASSSPSKTTMRRQRGAFRADPQEVIIAFLRARARTHARTHAHMHTNTLARTYARACMHAYTYTSARTRLRVHTQAHACMHAYVQTHARGFGEQVVIEVEELVAFEKRWLTDALVNLDSKGVYEVLICLVW